MNGESGLNLTRNQTQNHLGNKIMNGSKVTKELYMAENQGCMNEYYSASVTLRMSAGSAAMLNAIAARFDTSRYKLLEDELNAFAKDAFLALNDEDKKELALAADKEMTEAMLKKGASIKTTGMAGTFENEWSQWRSELAMLEKYDVVDGAYVAKEGEE